MQREKTISLTCSSCGGMLQIDADKKVLLCPFCGSKELIFESDAVKIAETQSNAYKEVEFGKQKTEIELKKMDIQEQDKALLRLVKSKLLGYLLILVGIGIILFCLEFSSGNGSMSIFLLIVGIIVIVFGSNILKLGRKK